MEKKKKYPTRPVSKGTGVKWCVILFLSVKVTVSASNYYNPVVFPKVVCMSVWIKFRNRRRNRTSCRKIKNVLVTKRLFFYLFIFFIPSRQHRKD